MENKNNYLYEVKDCFLTQNEMNYISALINCLPQGYYIQPQVGLRTIINRTDNSQYQNELHRYADACIFDKNYHPIAIIEINDSTHYQKSRQNRDDKVRKICEEAGLPIVTFWTKQGINQETMAKKIEIAIEEAKNPVRIKHSAQKEEQTTSIQPIVQIPEPPVSYIQPKIEPEYSKKSKITAILLSLFFGFIGLPYYYAGRPLMGIIASLPLALYSLFVKINIFVFPENVLFSLKYIFIAFIVGVNFISAIFFGFEMITDKNGKSIKK